MTRVMPEATGSWRRLPDDVGESHLAHSPEWATVIRRAYRHEPLYLAAEDEAGGAGLLPAFIVRRPLLGTVVTSMPFLDGGGPCSSSPALSSGLVEHLLAEARGAGADFVDLRCAQRLAIAAQPMEHKVNLRLSLPADADRLWRQLDRGVRNQIRKAERSGLSVEFGGADKLDDFYAVFAARMRELGSPVHHREFFRATLDCFGRQARVGLVRQGARLVGGLVALAVKDTLAVPWASCLKQDFALCPNMLMYWKTIRIACMEGFRQFDFGRSSRGSGTYHFKRQWGAAETPLFWYTIPIGSPWEPGPTGSRRTAACAARLWQQLPLGLTQRLGPKVRKYLIQ